MDVRTHLGLGLSLMLALGPVAAAQDVADDDEVARKLAWWNHARIDSVPPAALLYTRRLAQGEWSFSYRYERQELDGLRDGRDNLSTSEVLDDYETAPRDMTVQTHTLEVLYGVHRDLSLFASVPFIDKEMDNRAASGDDFETDSSGIGDVIVGGIYDVWDGDGEILRVHLGLGLPTGSYDEKDRDETGERVVLPYPMQLGAGTIELHPGATYLVQEESWSWGLHARWRIHVGENDDGWAVGDSVRSSAWAGAPITEDVGGYVRLEWLAWGDYHGRNDDLDAEENPAEDPNRQGGTRVDVLGGLTWGISEHDQVGFEIGVPIDEWLDGPQLSTEWVGGLRWETSF